MELAICVRNLPAKEMADVGRFAEDHGYAEVFVPDGARGGMTDGDGRLVGRDAFPGIAALFGATSSTRATLGVAATPMQDPLVLPITASTLFEMSDGRFSLGLGVSHPEQTARFGIPFPAQPVEYMRGWVREMRQRSSTGMAYGGGWTVHIAALGPRMVQLGAEEADGLILNWLTPAQTAISVQRVRDCAPTGAVPRTALYLRLMDTATARADAVRYDEMGNYHRNFVAQGITGPDEVVAQTTLPRHDLGAARARLEQYRESGLDVACIYPIGFDAEDRRALAELTA